MLIHRCGNTLLDYDEIKKELHDGDTVLPLKWKEHCPRCFINLRENRFNDKEEKIA